MYAKLFRAQANAYRSFRPIYPARLLDAVEEYRGVRFDKSDSVAVDVATGSGERTCFAAMHGCLWHV
jgi:hypothetical protein